jgi:Tfp pilus assembly protein PilO
LKINTKNKQKGEKRSDGETLLVMEATANTYRYLDQDELDANKKNKKKKGRR